MASAPLRRLRAFAIFRRAHPEFRLIVSGMHGFFSGLLHDLRTQLELGDAVEFPGWIPRQDLLDLFARAWSFVYPSRFEGFGIPVLEAMATGIPLACSNIEPLASIAGEAALLFDPADTAQIASAIERICLDDDLRVRLSTLGPLQAAQYTWEAAASATLEALQIG